MCEIAFIYIVYKVEADEKKGLRIKKKKIFFSTWYDFCGLVNKEGTNHRPAINIILNEKKNSFDFFRLLLQKFLCFVLSIISEQFNEAIGNKGEKICTLFNFER